MTTTTISQHDFYGDDGGDSETSISVSVIEV